MKILKVPKDQEKDVLAYLLMNAKSVPETFEYDDSVFIIVDIDVSEVLEPYLVTTSARRGMPTSVNGKWAVSLMAKRFAEKVDI